jgi:peptidyl-dipeptidase Dcp
MKAHLEDLQAIVDNNNNNNNSCSFESVIQAFDQSGSLMSKVSGVFSNMCSSMNTEELQKVQTEMSPILSKHNSKAYTLPGLFDKIDHVYQKRNDLDLNLNDEQIRLVERIHLDFVRQGAQLEEKAQEALVEIKARLATLRTEFMQNVMKDETDYELIVTLHDLDGCPESLIEAAKQAAVERNKGENDDEYVITLSRSLVEPFLVSCNNRDLRKQAWEAWTQRGQLDDSRNNIPIAEEMLKLRQKQAQLYGYKSFAEFQCVDRMAKTPETVMKLLEDVWERAKVSANKEREALEEYVQQESSSLDLLPDGIIQPWDWRFVAEKVRKAKYEFDEGLLKPYFSLDSVRQAMFAVSGKLFGLNYIPRPDIQTYHPDVDAYEVRSKADDNKLVAIFLHDNFSRPFKGSGAWMSEYRSQTKNLMSSDDPMEGIPIVSNNNNLAKAGGTTLLSHDGTFTFTFTFIACDRITKLEFLICFVRLAHRPIYALLFYYSTRCSNHVSRVWACPSWNVIRCHLWLFGIDECLDGLCRIAFPAHGALVLGTASPPRVCSSL